MLVIYQTADQELAQILNRSKGIPKPCMANQAKHRYIDESTF